MNLIIQFNVPHQHFWLSFIRTVIQHPDGIGRSQSIDVVSPFRIFPVYCFGPFPISTKVFIIKFRPAINRLGRVHWSGSSNGIGIGIACHRIHALCVEVNLQMLIKKRRGKIHTGRITLKTWCFQDTLLIGVAQGNTIRHIFQSTGNSDIMVGTDCRTINLVLPVGIGKKMLALSIRIS